MKLEQVRDSDEKNAVAVVAKGPEQKGEKMRTPIFSVEKFKVSHFSLGIE